MGEKGHDLAPVRSARRPEPSWPTVIKTTLRLWLERRKTARRARVSPRRRSLLALAVLLLAGLVAALVGFDLARPGSTPAAAQRSAAQRSAAQRSAAPSAATLQATALTRGQAGDWIAQQLSPAAIVSCDPAMSSVLQAHGVPAGRLLVLLLADADPLGSDVIVATPAVRSQFGARLITVYAPEVIASFGSGATRIDVRAIAPDGAQAFEASVAANRVARMAAGQQLLRNKRISASPAAGAALAAGTVDPRLLVTLAALAARQQVSIAAFGDPSPGAADVPLRSAEIGAATPAKLRSALSFLRAQRTPYLPADIRTIPVAHGQHVLSIEYGAPGPLGLGGE